MAKDKKSRLKKSEIEALVKFINEKFTPDLFLYENIKNSKLYDSRKQTVLEYIEGRDNIVLTTHQIIIDKIKDPNNNSFNSGDEKIISNFINTMGLDKYLSIDQGLNAIGINGFNEKSTSWDLMNIIKKADSTQDLNYQNWIKESPNLSKTKGHFEHLFSIVKFFQDPTKYPLNYKRWQFIRQWVLNENNIDYDGLCVFYRHIPQDEEYPDLEMQRYMDYICELIFNEIKENGDPELEKIARIGLRADDKDKKEKEEKGNDTSSQVLDDTVQPEPVLIEEPRETPDDYDTDALPLNLILYGPPGTGKTYHTVDKALERLLSPDELVNLVKGKTTPEEKREAQEGKFNEFKANHRIEFITFHQSMSYEDFIEGIKPKYNSKKKILEYPHVSGIFKDLCERAEKSQKRPYVLIIDEINRGNVSNIFGELITLIEKDKRKSLKRGSIYSAQLPYSKKSFSVPDNLYIIGTMNTADRSVEALDTALRRRFSFEEIKPNPDLLGTITIKGVRVSLAQVLGIINDRIEVLKDCDHLIGHSYFLKVENEKDLKKVFFDNIIPLLQEYFYGDNEKIQMVLGEGFVKTVNSSDILFANGKPYEDAPELLYRIQDNSGSFDLLEALKKMNIPLDIPVDGNSGE